MPNTFLQYWPKNNNKTQQNYDAKKCGILILFMFRSRCVCVCTILQYMSAKFLSFSVLCWCQNIEIISLEPILYTLIDTYHRKGWPVQPKWRVNSFRCNFNPFVFTQTHTHTHTYVSGARLFSYYPSLPTL